MSQQGAVLQDFNQQLVKSEVKIFIFEQTNPKLLLLEELFFEANFVDFF